MTSENQLKYAYFALILCMVISAIPNTLTQVFSMFFSFLLIIGFYSLRRKWKIGGPEYQETKEIIKTFWGWSMIYIGGILIASLSIPILGDMTALHEALESVAQGMVIPDEAMVGRVMQDFMDKNFWLITGITFLSVLPAQIYGFIRVKRGLARIKKAVKV